MFEAFVRKFNTLVRVGPKRLIVGRLYAACLHVLRFFLPFHRWHATDNYLTRPYKGYVVQLINSLLPKVAVELGCGLGDIVSRVDADCRIGIDPDVAVIRAAKLLRPVGVRWVCGDIAAVVPAAEGRRIDCFVAVGWLHLIPPETVRDWLLSIAPFVDHFIVDTFIGTLPP